MNRIAYGIIYNFSSPSILFLLGVKVWNTDMAKVFAEREFARNILWMVTRGRFLSQPDGMNRHATDDENQPLERMKRYGHIEEYRKACKGKKRHEIEHGSEK